MKNINKLEGSKMLLEAKDLKRFKITDGGQLFIGQEVNIEELKAVEIPCQLFGIINLTEECG